MQRLLLVVLLVLGWVGAGIPATATVASPAQVPAEQAQTQTAIRQVQTPTFPPGVTEDGVTDPLALVEAHQQTLRNTSYTISTTSSLVYLNGTLLSQSAVTSRVAPGWESYSTAASRVAPNATRPLGLDSSTIEVWANETRAVTARNLPGQEVTYSQSTRQRAGFGPTVGWDQLYTAFSAANTTVIDQFEQNGTTLFRIVSTDLPGSDSAYGNQSRYRFSALVDSQGVVHAFDLSFRMEYRDRPVVRSVTTRVTQIGNTTVERPEWYEQAVANETE